MVILHRLGASLGWMGDDPRTDAALHTEASGRAGKKCLPAQRSRGSRITRMLDRLWSIKVLQEARRGHLGVAASDKGC